MKDAGKIELQVKMMLRSGRYLKIYFRRKSLFGNMLFLFWVFFADNVIRMSLHFSIKW